MQSDRRRRSALSKFGPRGVTQGSGRSGVHAFTFDFVLILNRILTIEKYVQKSPLCIIAKPQTSTASTTSISRMSKARRDSDRQKNVGVQDGRGE
jgi:hypothetical protein